MTIEKEALSKVCPTIIEKILRIGGLETLITLQPYLCAKRESCNAAMVGTTQTLNSLDTNIAGQLSQYQC